MGFNNGPKLVTQGLDLLIDAADPGSYPGTGTVWTDLRSGVTGSLTGSVSYTTEYYGGLTFSDSSSAVIFPGTTANYGTGSFTVEMAFKPTYIEGRHYLMAKNSGSFPNWAIYLSGSNGSGKLWSEWNVSAAISCSVSSSTTFETGSVYQVDVRILPALSASGIYVNGQSEGGVLGNNGGSLATTASLFIGNYSQNNTQNFSGSIYAIKTYNIQSLTQPSVNYAAISTRLGKPYLTINNPVFELLVVAGGGGGGTGRGGGGGAGGLQYFSNFEPTPGISTVIVGNGGALGANGQNSVFSTYISIGGGSGGAYGGNGVSGGSGGGGGATNTSQVGASGTSGQGNSGGNVSGPLDNFNGGGGGGASTAGVDAASLKAGDGGSGSYIASFAAIGGFPSGWFAGGGGGASVYGGTVNTKGNGGIGGGGNGGYGQTGPVKATSGSANTGGGGGGEDFFASGGGTGGSGIVAIRYSGTPIALGGEITQSAGYTYHVFRTVGTSSFTIF